MKKTKFEQEIYVHRLRPRTSKIDYASGGNKRKSNDSENGSDSGSRPAKARKVLGENNNPANSPANKKETRSTKRRLTDENNSGSERGRDAPTKKLKVEVPIEIKNRRSADALKNEGNKLFNQGNFQWALVKYSQAINLCPNSAIYYSNRAACHMKLNNYQSCISDAQRSIDLDEKFAKGHYRLIKCYLALGEIDKAEAAINRVVDLKMKNSEIDQEQKQFQKLLDLNTKIYEKYDMKNFSPCLNFIYDALSIASACYRYKVLKAECMCYLGTMHNSYLTNYSNMHKLKKTDEQFLRGLIAYYVNDDMADAFEKFKFVLDEDPNHLKTKACLDKAAALKKKKEQGNNLFNEGKYAEAIEMYAEALTIDPFHKITNSILYFNRALAHSKLNNPTEAVNDCTEALKLNPKNFKAIVKRANLYFELEKYKDCIQDCKAALRIQKVDHVQTLLQKARAKVRESIRNNYQILEVSRNASLEEIKKSYHRLARIHHPDRHVTESAEVKRQQEVKFKEIGQAYAVLSDPDTRKTYDYRLDNSINDDEDTDNNDGGGSGTFFVFSYASGCGTFVFQCHGGYPFHDSDCCDGDNCSDYDEDDY